MGSSVTGRTLGKIVVGAAVLGAVATWSLAEGPSTEKQIMKQGDLRAFVSGDTWCQEVVHAIVHAPTAASFEGDRIDAQRMIGHLRIALSEDCPAAVAIMIDGFGGGEHIYAGMASKATGWILEESKPPTVGSHVSDCDLLAAHPDDPEKNEVAGIADEDMDGKMAVTACLDEVEEDPDDPVLHFQLGRAYWKLEQYDKAVEQLLVAAEDDHGGALAYLGDVVLYGVGGVESDPEVARQLYARAVEEGFEPASVLVDAIVTDPKTDEPEAVAASSGAAESADLEESYHHPDLMEALSNGQASPPGVWPGRMMIYSFSSITGVFSKCEDLSPKGFDSKEAFLKAMNTHLTYTEKLNLAHSYDNGAFAEFQEAASEDGIRLVSVKGCAASETKTLVKTVLDHYGMNS